VGVSEGSSDFGLLGGVFSMRSRSFGIMHSFGSLFILIIRAGG